MLSGPLLECLQVLAWKCRGRGDRLNVAQTLVLGAEICDIEKIETRNRRCFLALLHRAEEWLGLGAMAADDVSVFESRSLSLVNQS